MEFQSPFEFATIEDRLFEEYFDEHFEFLDEGVLDNLKTSKFYKDIKAAVKNVEKIFREELKKFGSFNNQVKNGVDTKGQTKAKDINIKTVEPDKIDGHGVQIATFKNVDNEMIQELKGRVNARIKDYGKITSHKSNNRSSNSSAPNGFIMFVYKKKPLTEQEFDLDINKEVYNEAVAYNYINEAHIKRSQVKDEDFGVPSQKKFPMTDAKHVKSAIKFFNYVDSEHEAELARNIKKKMQHFGINMDDIHVSERNRFHKYIKKSVVKENQFHGEANSHIEFESALFGEPEIVVTEGVREIIRTVKEAVIKFFTTIIEKIKKLLGLDKVKKSDKVDDLKDMENQAQENLKRAQNMSDDDAKEAQAMKSEADKMKEEFESTAESIKKGFEYTAKAAEEIKKSGEKARESTDKGWEEIHKRMDKDNSVKKSEESTDKGWEEIDNIIDSINKNHERAAEEINNSLKNIEANLGTEKEEEQLRKIEEMLGKGSKKSKNDKPGKDKEIIDVEYKEVGESYIVDYKPDFLM